MKRVCIVVRTTPFHSLGGMQELTWTTAVGLARRDHDVTVITSRHPEGVPRLAQDGVDVHFLAGTRPERYSAAFFAGAYVKFRALAAAAPFDLVHSQSHAALAFPAGLGIPLVAQLHGVWFSETEYDPHVFGTLGLRRRLVNVARLPQAYAELRRLHRFARRARLTVVDSDFSRRELCRVDRRLDPGRVTVVPCGIDLERFRPIPRAEAKRALGLEGRVVLFLSRLVPSKGVYVALRAFERLGETGARLLVAGEGYLKREVQAYVAARRLPRVSFVDVSEAAKPTYYAAADLFVYPELTAPAFGFVAAEAMACGTPVVASDGGAIPEVVGDAGVLVPRGDVAALARALGEALADPARLAELGRRGRERATARFGKDRMVDALVAVYRTLA